MERSATLTVLNSQRHTTFERTTASDPGGPAGAQCSADASPVFPLTVVMGTNDEFVYTPIATGIPETFTVAPGTYTTLADLIVAVAAAVGESSEAFSTIAAGAPSAIETPATTNFLNPTSALPVTIVSATNDEFVYTPGSTGTPETFTLAPGTLSTIPDVIVAINDAVGSTSGEPFSTFCFASWDGVNPFFAIRTVGTGAIHNSDTITSGTHDFLAALDFSSPIDFANAEDHWLVLTLVATGSAHDGDEFGPGANDVSVDLGFTEDPNSFQGGTP